MLRSSCDSPGFRLFVTSLSIPSPCATTTGSRDRHVLAHALLYFIRDKGAEHMKLKSRLFSSLCVSTIAVFAYATAVEARPSYTITQIGPLPTTFDVRYDAHGLNNKGEVAGSVVTNENYRGFFWRDGQITVIEPITA